ncbi:MAG TPA: alpha/beta hydrolase [Polyangiaceae bacterium]|nr:alpha/beta hydrolase [Polyangiaceae bacterium]
MHQFWGPLIAAALRVAGFSAIVLCASASDAHAEPRVVRDVKFARAGDTDLLLDLYLPDAKPAPGKTPAPAAKAASVGLIVWVHGGAWRAGSRSSVDLVGLTERGWALASVDYRLSTVARFPAQVHDIKAAVRYLRAHAAEHGYPPERIVIAGSSAGAHLAALVGVSNGHPELEGSTGSDAHTSSDVQAIVSLYGASNLTTILAQSTPHGLSVRVPALELLLGAKPDATPELARLASPIFHVDAKDPPLYLSHGDQDNQMPINQSHELEGAYQKLGLPVRFSVIHGSGHGGPGFTTPEQLAAIDTFLREQLGVAKR